MKLHEVVAARTARQKDLLARAIELRNTAGRERLFEGMMKTYEPKEEEGIEYPPESQVVRDHASRVTLFFQQAMGQILDLVATNDAGNNIAKADIVIDEVTIAESVPVTTLMYLEKWIGHVSDFVKALPTTSPEHQWSLNKDTSLYVTEPSRRIKTKKVRTPVVLYEATEHHPAQVELASEDVPEGVWTTVLMSSALAPVQKETFLARVEKLTVAIKQARGRANMQEVKKVEIADSFFDYLFFQ